MARISDIKLPDGTQYDIGTSTGAEFIYGTQTATTNAWTGVTKDPELYDGKEIIYFLPFAGNSNGSTLNLTLADGTKTGAKNVYFNSTTRHTTHYGQYQMIRMVYHNSLTINGTAYSGWWIDYARDTNTNDTAYYVRTTQILYKTATVLYRYQICLEVNDTTIVPINTVNNSSRTTNKTLTTSSFKPFGKILYYNNTSTVNANATIPGDRLGYASTVDLGYSFNTGTTLTAQKAVYLVCTPQADGTAKLYSTPITQTLPTTEDGRYYIYLGQTYSTSNIYLYENHPIYMYKNGAVREVSQYAENVDIPIATQSVNGLMSSTDKSKLDGISSSYNSTTETLTINL